MTRECGMTSSCTRLQHLVDSKTFLKKKKCRDNTGLTSQGEGPGKGLPESRDARGIDNLSQKGNVHRA